MDVWLENGMTDMDRPLFEVKKVHQYNDDYRYLGSYKFCHFSGEVLNMDADELSYFVDKTIEFLTKHRDAIANLRSIDIGVVENDLDPKVYKLIINHGITNIYELRKSVHRRYTGEISSRIVGVAKIKGEQIVKVMEDKGYMIDLYTTEKWDEILPKAQEE
jgi:hypothetical protein